MVSRRVIRSYQARYTLGAKSGRAKEIVSES
jgi:hypothetical protein